LANFKSPRNALFYKSMESADFFVTMLQIV